MLDADGAAQETSILLVGVAAFLATLGAASLTGGSATSATLMVTGTT